MTDWQREPKTNSDNKTKSSAEKDEILKDEASQTIFRGSKKVKLMLRQDGACPAATVPTPRAKKQSGPGPEETRKEDLGNLKLRPSGQKDV